MSVVHLVDKSPGEFCMSATATACRLNPDSRAYNALYRPGDTICKNCINIFCKNTRSPQSLFTLQREVLGLNNTWQNPIEIDDEFRFNYFRLPVSNAWQIKDVTITVQSLKPNNSVKDLADALNAIFMWLDSKFYESVSLTDFAKCILTPDAQNETPTPSL